MLLTYKEGNTRIAVIGFVFGKRSLEIKITTNSVIDIFICFDDFAHALAIIRKILTEASSKQYFTLYVKASH